MTPAPRAVADGSGTVVLIEREGTACGWQA